MSLRNNILVLKDVRHWGKCVGKLWDLHVGGALRAKLCKIIDSRSFRAAMKVNPGIGSNPVILSLHLLCNLSTECSALSRGIMLRHH